MTWPRTWPWAALLCVFFSSHAGAAPVSGRVFDSVEARVFADAALSLPRLALVTRTDDHGFFKFRDVPPGSHLVEIALPDGRVFSAHLLVRKSLPSIIAEFDYARVVPPDDDDEY